MDEEKKKLSNHLKEACFLQQIKMPLIFIGFIQPVCNASIKKKIAIGFCFYISYNKDSVADVTDLLRLTEDIEDEMRI